MSDFDIDQYEISIFCDELTTTDSSEISVNNLYPVLNEPNDAECTVVLTEKTSYENADSQKAVFRDWLIDNLFFQRRENSTRIALIEEISEVRCITYEELVDGAKRTANYLFHHGVKHNDRVLVCMENSVESIFYNLGAIFLGAVPVLVKPNHAATDKLEDIGCTSAIVDFDHYNNFLNISQSSLKQIERIFVLAEDIAAIHIPRHVWILDGYGFLNFSIDFNHMQFPPTDLAFIIPGSHVDYKYVVHTQTSAYYLCNGYFDDLRKLSLEGITEREIQTHLITNGLQSHDAFSYFIYIIVNGNTCVLSESTLEIWRASFLDRIAGMIEQYHIRVLIANSQLIRCFLKYEVHKIYDLKSLKVVTNHGSAVAASVAKKFTKILNVVFLQAYSSAEFGVASFGVVNGFSATELSHFGVSSEHLKIKIADPETGREMGSGEWGEIILNGKTMFKQYAGSCSSNSHFLKSWFKTGDYGMLDKENHLHFEGSISTLIRAQGKKEVSPERMESVMSRHKLVQDVVVMQSCNEVSCGLILKDHDNCPTAESLESLLKRNDIYLAIGKIFVLDFIPRAENGEVLRAEIPYLLSTEKSIAICENTESYI